MNLSAYLASGKVIAFLESISRARVRIHGRENIPAGAIIFVINHFTRIETLLMPYHIFKLTDVPVWSLADATFFEGPLRGVLESVGALSTRDPDRDRLIVKSLLTGEANWIIYPEGRMVKDKEVGERSRLAFFRRKDVPAPHTGAATLALRSEFYRQRLIRLASARAPEASRLQTLFGIDDLEPVLKGQTRIVPVNITYYPLRARQNLLSTLAERFAGTLSQGVREELLTEGTMLLDGVDIDIRFGKALVLSEFLTERAIQQDLSTSNEINFDDRLPSLQTMRREARLITDRYMAAIYDMTTVNHDHLFTSLLRAMFFNRINEADFRRRAFLLAAQELPKTAVNCHQSLAIGQIALLTDDRYHKYRDFCMLAMETGVLQRKGKLIVRDPAKFSASLDPHRARLENPLGVIANEVVPLSELQQKVRAIAWLPGLLVRKRVAALLERQALEEYETDYRSFHLPGEAKAYAVGAPVLLRGRDRELGVVLVHGYLAAPLEMAELATYLHNKGLTVYLVRLRGHGTSPEDLAERTGTEWIDSVDRGYALMSALCKRVVIGGFSFGGGLALDAATRINNLAGVFAACPPLRLRARSARLAPIVAIWNRVKELAHLHGHKKEFIDITPEHPHINYLRLPLQGMWELERFMKSLEERLHEVKVPTLLLQSDGDQTVDPKGTEQIFEHLGSTDKAYRTFAHDRHGILLGEGSEQVHAEIGSFIDRLRREC